MTSSEPPYPAEPVEPIAPLPLRPGLVGPIEALRRLIPETPVESVVLPVMPAESVTLVLPVVPAPTPVEPVPAPAPVVEPVVVAVEVDEPAVVPVEVAAPRPKRRRAPKRRLSAPAAVHGLSLLLGLVLLTALGQGLWFNGDEWDFIISRGFHHPAVGFMVPHNEHWSALPIVLWRIVFTIEGLHAYWPYLILVTLAHLIGLHLLWRILGKIDVNPWLATVMVASAIPLGVGAENLFWAFQIGFVGSVTFGMAGILLVIGLGEGLRQGPRLIGVWAVLILGLTCSGIGVTMVIATAAVAFVVRGLRPAILAAVVPTLVYAGWYLEWGKDAVSTDTAGVTSANVDQVPGFIANGLTSTLGGWAVITDAGAVIMLLLIVVVGLRGRRGTVAVPLAMLATAVLFYGITALGRVGFGVAQASASRYSYIAMFLLLPAIVVGLELLVKRGGLVVPIGVAVALSLGGVASSSAFDTTRSTYDLNQQSEVFADAALLETGVPVVAISPLNAAAPQLTTTGLRQLIAEGKLPTLPVIPAAALLQAHLDLQVSAVPTEVSGDAAPMPVRATGLPKIDQTGCLAVPSGAAGRQLAFDVEDQTASISLTLPTPGTINVFLGAKGGVSPTGPDTFMLPAGTTWLRDSEPQSYLTLGLPAGAAQVCHLTPLGS